MKRIAVLASAFVCSGGLLVGCGGGSSANNAGSKPSPTPSPTPTLPTAVADRDALSAALVKPAELGPRWVQPKDVNKVKDSGKKDRPEFCPGKVTAFVTVPGRAHVSVSMTNGTKRGADIGSFDLYSYDSAQLDSLYAALLDVAQVCKQWKAAEGNYDVVTVYPNEQVPQADQSAALLESVYADAAHKQLQYVRQFVVGRSGRFVCAFERAYLTTKADPKGVDFTETLRLAGIQLAKLKALS